MGSGALSGASGGSSRDGADVASSREAVGLVVDVQVPAGVPRPKVIVSFAPGTHEEFEAVVDACGGPGAFQDCHTFAFAVFDGFHAHLHPPESRPQAPLRDPFMVAFAERIATAKTVTA